MRVAAEFFVAIDLGKGLDKPTILCYNGRTVRQRLIHRTLCPLTKDFDTTPYRPGKLHHVGLTAGRIAKWLMTANMSFSPSMWP